PVTSTPSDQERDTDRAQEVRDKLRKPVTLDQGIVNSTLKDVLEHFSDRFDLPIVVATQAFQAAGTERVDDQPLTLPKVTNIKLRDLLRLLVAQLNGAYQVRPGFVEILPFERTLPQFWKEKRNLAPTVSVQFVNRPLDDALRELSQSSDITIVLDGR